MSQALSALSFAVSLQSAQKGGATAQIKTFRRALAEALRSQKSPSTLVVFVSGAPSLAADIAGEVALAAPLLRALVVPGAGVLTETAEVEGLAAAAGLLWSSGKARVDADDQALLETNDTRLVFGAKDALTPDVLAKASAGCLFGAGTTADLVYGVDAGRVISAKIVSLALTGQGAPVVESSSACRTVASQFEVTKMDGQVVLSLDGRPALEVLSSTVGGGKQGGLILVALDSSDHDSKVFRPLKGIDPSRRGIVIDAPLAEGDKLSFAVRDPAHAKADLAEAARRAEQRALGSAPRFALYLSCAGRGRALYRDPDIDVRTLRKRFPKLPIAGMHSAFEIVPDKNSGRIELMTGVFALFRAPS